MRYAIRWFKCKLKPPKNKLDEEKRSEDILVKQLQAKVRKTQTALQKEREKVSYLKTRNVKRRDETKQKQIFQLKSKLETKSEDAKELSVQLKDREAKIAKKRKDDTNAGRKMFSST